MKELKTIAEIKQAVNDGQQVFSDSHAYSVVKDRLNQFLIVCRSNQYTTGLHGKEGTKYENNLNGTKFFVDNDYQL